MSDNALVEVVTVLPWHYYFAKSMLTVMRYSCCLNPTQFLSVPVSTIDHGNLFWNSCLSSNNKQEEELNCSQITVLVTAALMLRRSLPSQAYKQWLRRSKNTWFTKSVFKKLRTPTLEKHLIVLFLKKTPNIQERKNNLTPKSSILFFLQKIPFRHSFVIPQKSSGHKLNFRVCLFGKYDEFHLNTSGWVLSKSTVKTTDPSLVCISLPVVKQGILVPLCTVVTQPLSTCACHSHRELRGLCTRIPWVTDVFHSTISLSPLGSSTHCSLVSSPLYAWEKTS